MLKKQSGPNKVNPNLPMVGPEREMAQLDAADSMPGNWLGLGLGLGLGLVKNNLKVKLLKVGLASNWPGIELGWHRVGGIESAASKVPNPFKGPPFI